MMKDLEEQIDAETAHLDMTESPTIREREDEIETDGIDLEKVRHRAYLLWRGDGEQHGRDQNYWFQAEREIAEEEGEPDR